MNSARQRLSPQVSPGRWSAEMDGDLRCCRSVPVPGELFTFLNSLSISLPRRRFRLCGSICCSNSLFS